ncbi:hypothetical protein TNCV_4181241 [Trichonephila clavipes]|nr:hypothetical protein TNCV_4181241 [Trichonephila clavipes]
MCSRWPIGRIGSWPVLLSCFKAFDGQNSSHLSRIPGPKAVGVCYMTMHPVSHPSGIVVSDADCGAVGAGFVPRLRHGCLRCNHSLLCDVCFPLTSMQAPV